LLEESLKSYLDGYIVDDSKANIYVSDRALSLDKPIFLIGNSPNADLKVPFTKDQLLTKLYNLFLSKTQTIPNKNKKPMYVKF
jgi:hypothetical protein